MSTDNEPAKKTVVSDLSGDRFTPPTVAGMNAVLPQFEFVEMIGLGGMGAVYKARQPKLNRFVAIKVLPPIPDDELGFAERFKREAQAMASLSHPHIVGVHDFGETEGGQLYFVMEFIEGADLHKLIVGGQLTLDHFYGWVPQICDALQYAHKNGVVHRDIKPANILINTEGNVKMADFGLAKLTNGPEESRTALTHTDLSMGTPDYAAPEQIESTANVDWRADIYSVGVLMYQLLTGHVPRGAFKTPSQENYQLDPRLDEVVLKAMQAAPDDRFQNAKDISSKLTEIRTTARQMVVKKRTSGPRAGHNTRPIPAHLVTPQSNFPKGRLIAAIAVAVILVATILTATVVGLKKADGGGKSKNGGEKIVAEPEPAPVRKQEPVVAAVEGKSKSQEEALKAKSEDSKPAKGVRPANPSADTSEPMRPPKGRPGFNAFREKMGKRFGEDEQSQPEGPQRKQFQNILAVSRQNGPLPKGDPLLDIPKDLRRVRSLVIGQSPSHLKDAPGAFAIALQVNRTVVAWGDDTFGQTKVPEDLVNIQKIAAGTAHALVLKKDGTVLAWGDNRNGQTDVPPGLSYVVAIDAGNHFSVALSKSGSLTVWGEFPTEQIPTDLTGVTEIAAGFDHIVALKSDGTIGAWGNNQFGQISMPEELPLAKSITATMGFTAVLTQDGRVFGWGPSNGGNFKNIRENISEIQASGDLLACKNSKTGRWDVHGPGMRGLTEIQSNAFRSEVGELRFAVTPEIAFIYKAPESTFEITEGAEPVPELEPEPPAEIKIDPESEAGKRIADLQQKFEIAYVQQVSEPFDKRQLDLDLYYRSAITRDQQAAAAAKDLPLAVALKAEMDAISEHVSLPDKNGIDTPEKLAGLRATYRTESAKILAERHEKESELLQKFDSALEAIRDELTAMNLLEDALKIQEFIDKR